MDRPIQTIKDLANAVRGRREDLGLSQAAVAHRAGLSRKWLVEFEGGNPTAKLEFVLAVLAVLELRLGLDEVPSVPDANSLDLDAILDEYRRPHND